MNWTGQLDMDLIKSSEVLHLFTGSGIWPCLGFEPTTLSLIWNTAWSAIMQWLWLRLMGRNVAKKPATN